MSYNYFEAVKQDVKEYINNEIELSDYIGRKEELEEELNDTLFCADSVTGNGSGSYTFSRYQAMENVFSDMDSVVTALEEFGYDLETIGKKFIEQDFEWFDVITRCYFVNQAVYEVIQELESNGVFEEEEEEENIFESINAAADMVNDFINKKNPEIVTA